VPLKKGEPVEKRDLSTGKMHGRKKKGGGGTPLKVAFLHPRKKQLLQERSNCVLASKWESKERGGVASFFPQKEKRRRESASRGTKKRGKPQSGKQKYGEGNEKRKVILETKEEAVPEGGKGYASNSLK